MKNILDKYSNKKILITGANGYIGNQLKTFFNKNKIYPNCSIGDLSNKEIWKINLDKEVDIIFHLAAAEGENKDISMNSKSILALLEACVEKNIKPKIIYASSTNTFGLTNARVVNEKTKSFPLSEYSAHKILGENYLKQFHKKYKIPSIILRIPNIYGPSAMKKNFNKSIINKVVAQSLKKKNLKLFNNRSCLRDFLYIDDVINAFVLCSKLDNKFFNGNFYVLSSKEKTTIKDVWKIIQNKTNNKNLTIDDKNLLSPMEYRNFSADSSKFRKLTRWKSKTKLDRGIDLIINYLK
jgi:nucleoside-diphosphate-sugar epimerase